MPFVSVTRLRLRSWARLPQFAIHASNATRQCSRAAGFVGGSVLPDRRLTFWTLTMWNDEAAMRAYMTNGAHRTVMPKLMDWCDEASVVHWTQDDPTPPGWAEADRRMRSEGRASKVRNPGAAHLGLTFAAPRTIRAGRIRPAPMRP